MIDKFKLGIKLLKYCYGIKRCALSALLFFAIGILIFPVSQQSFIGPFYLIVSAVFVTQLLNSLSMASLVLCSPRKKDLQTWIPTLVGLPFVLLMYGVAVLMELLLLHMGKTQVSNVVSALVITGMLTLMVLVYSGLAYKHFLVSILLFFVGFLVTAPLQYLIHKTAYLYISLWGAVLIGILEILLGSCLQYFVSLRVYRKSMDRTAQLHGLQKYM